MFRSLDASTLLSLNIISFLWFTVIAEHYYSSNSGGEGLLSLYSFVLLMSSPLSPNTTNSLGFAVGDDGLLSTNSDRSGDYVSITSTISFVRFSAPLSQNNATFLCSVVVDDGLFSTKSDRRGV